MVSNYSDKFKISVLIWLQFLLFVIYINFFTLNDFLIYFIFMIFIYLAILLGNNLYGFIVLVISSFIVAFKQVYTAWARGDFYIQSKLIIKQLFGIIFLILFWILLSYISNLIIENSNLKIKLKSLEKNDEITGVLTKNELIERFKIIFTSMKRRNQSGFFITLKLNGFNIVSRNKMFYSKSVIKLLSKICLDSIRSQYDLIGILRNNILLIVLQNTELNGTQIVIERIKNKIKAEGNINADVILNNLEIQTNPIPENLDNAINFIESLEG